MLHALHDGPWFILNHFLSVRRWELKFLASEAQLTYSAIWLHLPQLPTEFYDIEILQKLGNNVGKLLKIDACTSTTTRGRYTRICVEVSLDKPLKSHIYIGTHKQIILYEGLNLLCVNCCCLGHNKKQCTHLIQFPVADKASTNTSFNNPQVNPTTSLSPTNVEQEWKIVTFPQKSISKMHMHRQALDGAPSSSAGTPPTR